MTIGIRIICKTKIAEDSLRTHLLSVSKKRGLQKLSYKQAVNEHLIVGPPMVLETKLKSKRMASMVLFGNLEKIADSMMTGNKAIKNVDYTTEEIE